MKGYENSKIPRLFELMKEKNISAAKLAGDLGTTQSNVSEWKSGRSSPTNAMSKTIANYFNVSSDYLLGKSDERVNEELLDSVNEIPNTLLEKYGNIHDAKNAMDESALIVMDSKKIRLIPVYESVSAGFGAYANESVIDYIPLFIKSPEEAKETMCITVTGNSMRPKIEDGDIIQVHKQTSVDSGQIAVVLLDNEALVKKVEYGTDYVELHSFNPIYPVMRIEGENLSKLEVVGLVKKIIKNV